MIVQYYAPGILFQCKECKVFEKCEAGQRNPTAAQCNSGEPTTEARKAHKELAKKLYSGEGVEV